MTQSELDKILKEHAAWLACGCSTDSAGKKAYLVRQDLSRLNLKNADLRYANLEGANLEYANMEYVNLEYANLGNALLENANLRYANLENALLENANLRNAYLRNTNLTNANLEHANLKHVNLGNAYNVPYIPMACPDCGEFVAWKAARLLGTTCHELVVIKLLIPEDAKRLSGTERKCRSDKAIVLSIESMDGLKFYKKAYSVYDATFEYEVRKTVFPKDKFCDNRWIECASGIHWFINRQEAVDYCFW